MFGDGGGVVEDGMWKRDSACQSNAVMGFGDAASGDAVGGDEFGGVGELWMWLGCCF